MEAEQRRGAKEQMMALIQASHRWQEASAQVGIQVSRSTASRLLRQVRTRGKAAFQDGRHGHPAKLRTAERVWLETYRRASPGTPSRVVQTALQAQFDIQISIGYLNQVRANLGLGSRTQEVVLQERRRKQDEQGALSPVEFMLLLQRVWRPVQPGLAHLLCSPLAVVLSSSWS